MQKYALNLKEPSRKVTKVTTNFLLGVDGGGTRTVALIADEQGRLVGRGETDGSSYKSVGIEKSRRELEQAVDKALQKVEQHITRFSDVCFGMAGCDTRRDFETYKKIIQKSKVALFIKKTKLLICNDTHIALAAGTDKDYGIVIVAGTGSNCYGRNPQGEESSCGGMDWLLSDEGSAFDLGVKALKAVLWEYDGRGEATLLTPIILKNLGKKDILELVDWVYQPPFEKKRLASLALSVDVAFSQKDKVANKIVSESAESLVLMGKTVIKRLGLAGKEFDFILSGGMFKLGEDFINQITSSLKNAAPFAHFIVLKKEPAWGALRLALKNRKTT